MHDLRRELEEMKGRVRELNGKLHMGDDDEVQSLDGPIRANRFADSRESRLILAIRFRVSEPNPFFCESRFGGAKIANRRFEAIRANRSHVMKIGFFSANRFARIDSRESPRFALRIARPSKVQSSCRGSRGKCPKLAP